MTPRAYIVGGAVRDALLGQPASDRDWVVVGATPAQLIAAGYKPVGRDFPVFLHPETGEEHALARTERKSAPGYRGFNFHAAPEVTLEQDLARRDLTINAMARDAEGTLIDPFGGARDLRDGVLRHVSAAFAEDPVRLLRVARFGARWPQFRVAPETQALLRQIVAAGEVDALVPERVWQELSRGLMEARPSRMVDLLRDCGALARLWPALDRSWQPPPEPADSAAQARGVMPGAQRMILLDHCAAVAAPLPVRHACLSYRLQDSAEALDFAGKLRVPSDCADLADLLARERDAVQASSGLGARALLELLERCDALRRPPRFAHLLQACACIEAALATPVDALWPPGQRLEQALTLVQAVDASAAAAAALAAGLQGPAVGQAVREARVAALGSCAGKDGQAVPRSRA